MTEPGTPTAVWLAVVPALPALCGHEGSAERLLLLMHFGIDWDRSWVRGKREVYWDKVLPGRVRDATYRSATLDQWWSVVATDLVSSPRTSAERLELAALLREPADPVLHVLRESTEALILRTRIVSEHRRAARANTAI